MFGNESSLRGRSGGALRGLFATTALASGLFGGALLVTTVPAYAACTLNGQTIACDGTDADGYQATVNDNRYVSISPNAVIGNSTTQAGAISVDVSGGAGNFIDFDTQSNGSNQPTIGSANNGQAVNLISGANGYIAIDTAAGTNINTTGNGDDGFRLRNGAGGGTGSITVNLVGTTISTSQGEGIDAIAGSGGVSISVTNGKIGDTSYTSQITSTGSHGISAASAGGSVSVETAEGVAVSGDEAGIKTQVSSGNGNTTVTVRGNVTGTNAALASNTGSEAGAGIYATNISGGTGKVDVTNYATITAQSQGIYVDSNATGTVTVSNLSANSINAVGDGITATGAGDVIVNNGSGGVDNPDGKITSSAGRGIVATGTGIASDVTVNHSGTGSSITAQLDGISASITNGAGTGVITINASAAITSNTDDGIQTANAGSGKTSVLLTGDFDLKAGNGSGDAGIQAVVASGELYIDVGTEVDITATEMGIDAVSNSGGNIEINLNGDITQTLADIDGAGISARVLGDDGAITMTLGQYSTIDAVEDGVRATISDADNDDGITITSWADIDSETNDGIQASTAGNGNIKVDVKNGFIRAGNGGGDAGIQVNANGNGGATVLVGVQADIEATEDGIDVTSNGTGAIVIDVDGDITQTGALGAGAAAIQATSLAAGTGSITIDTGRWSEINAQEDGINAQILNAASLADIEINARGDITSSVNDGIAASNAGAGDIYVNVYGDITAGKGGGDAGIEAIALGSGNANVYTGWRSDIWASDIGIDARALAGGNVDMELWGDVDSGGIELYADTTGGTGDGTTTIDIMYSATINGIAGNSGADDLVLDVDGGAATITNWGTVYGRVDLTSNDDTFNNNSFNSWITVGDNDFGDGDDLFDNNGGTYTAVDDTVSETTRFLGLETLINSGFISMQDGGTGDVTETADIYQGEFGALGVDAYLSGATGSYADRFVIGGEAQGFTELYVDDANGGPGTYDPDGVLVIDANGAINGDGSEFALANGPLDYGLYNYDLFYDAPDFDWYLVSGPNERAFELSTIGSLSQDMFATGLSTWHDRTADLRSSNATLDGGGGAWLRGVGLTGERDHDTSYTDSMTWTYQDTSETTVGGIVGGVDTVFSTGDMQVIGGVLGSYMASSTSFGLTDTSLDIQGTGVGAYITILNGGFFVDAVGKVEFLQIDHATSYPWADSAETEGVSYGGIIDAGYRAEFGAMRIEPLASIAFTQTTIDAFELLGNDISYDDQTSVRGRVGLRVSGSFATEMGSIEPFAEVSLWNEFAGENDVTLSGGATNLTLTDNVSGASAELKAGVEVFSQAGWSGFASGVYKVGENSSSVGGQVGLRYDF